MSDDNKIPELPSDEELGIAGLSEDDFIETGDGGRGGATPPPKGRKRRGGGGSGDGSGGGGGGGKAPPPSSGGGGDGTSDGRRPSIPGGPAWRGVVTLIFLVAGVWLSSSQRWLPAPEAANAPDTAFSSARAMTTVVEMARRPHPPGSPEHDRVRALVVDRLTELGLTPEVHTHLVVRSPEDASGSVRTATVRNVLARLPGSASTGTVLLMAHYDGRTLSRAAGDDATGVAAILETVRALQGELPLANDLLVLLTDGEELGLLGARAFVAEHLDSADVKLVLNVEMRGGGGPAMMFETGAENGWVVTQLAQADPHPAANSLALEVYRRMPNDTDYSPFRDAGIQGLNSAGIGRGNVYHQRYDDPAHLDEATVQHHGARLLALARHLGTTDLTSVQAPDRGYTVLPVVGLVHYPLSTVPLVGAGLILGLLVVVGLVLLRGGRLGGVALGSGMAVATMGLAAAGGWGLFTWARTRHPEYGALHGAAFHDQGPYLLATAAWALAMGSFCWAVARRWAGVGALAVGAAVIPTALAAGVAFTAPGAAAVFAGPAAALLLAAGIAGLAGSRRDAGAGVWVVGVATGGIALLFLVPTVELVADAMTFSFAPGIGALMGLTVICAAPLLEGLLAPNRWWAPLTAVVVAAAGVGMGVMAASPDADAPAPSTLIYVQDQGGPQQPVQAWWVGADDGSGAWAAERTGATFDTELPEAASYGIRPGSAAATAPAVTLAPLQLTILRDTVVGAGRRVRVGIPRPRRPEAIRVSVGEGTGLVALDTVPLPPVGATRPRTLVHHGTPADSLLVVEVELPLTAQAVDLTVQEEVQRPWELVDSATWRRDETLAPNIVTFSDRAVIRSFHRILLQGADPVEASGMGTGELPGSGATGDQGTEGREARPDTLSPRPDTARSGGPGRR